MPVLSATKRCRHVELEQFWQAFASRGFVSDSWAFLVFFSRGVSNRSCVLPSFGSSYFLTFLHVGIGFKCRVEVEFIE